MYNIDGSVGAIGVDRVEARSGCEPRCRWPRKKRPKNKSDSSVRSRCLIKRQPSCRLLPAEADVGVCDAG